MKKIVSLLFICILVFVLQTSCNTIETNTPNDLTQSSILTISASAPTTTTKSSTKYQEQQNTQLTLLYQDYSFIKEFKTIEQYKQEFLAYKTFDDIKKSVDYKYYPDNQIKIDKSYASMMLKDKFFLVLNNKFKLKKINFQLDWAYVMFHYEINSKEVVIGYCTSKEMAKGYSFFKEKPDIITEDGRELHLTKHTPPQYHWYDEELETAFCVESELFNDEDVMLECINDLTIEKINIV